MYCPQCATDIAETATRCPRCDLDIQPIAQLLLQNDDSVANVTAQRIVAARVQHWKRQRHSFGLLLIMGSLLVGCFIPISIGLFNGTIVLGSLVTWLAGLAGILLVLGIILILIAEGTIRTAMGSLDDVEMLQHTSQTAPTIKLLDENKVTPPLSHNQSSSVQR